MELVQRRQVCDRRAPERRALYWSMRPEGPEQLVVSEKPTEWGPDLLWVPTELQDGDREKG